jgi:hypothetical protein
MSVPVLTEQERANALKKAQEARSKRTELRKKLKTGEVQLTYILNETENETMTRMRVKYLLESLPHIGKATAKKMMEDIGIDEARRVQGLGTRQRAALLEALA